MKQVLKNYNFGHDTHTVNGISNFNEKISKTISLKLNGNIKPKNEKLERNKMAKTIRFYIQNNYLHE